MHLRNPSESVTEHHWNDEKGMPAGRTSATKHPEFKKA